MPKRKALCFAQRGLRLNIVDCADLGPSMVKLSLNIITLRWKGCKWVKLLGIVRKHKNGKKKSK